MKTTQKSAAKQSMTSKNTSGRVPAKKTNALQIDDEAIRQRAYEIFLQNGSHDDHQNWIAAERELMGAR